MPSGQPPDQVCGGEGGMGWAVVCFHFHTLSVCLWAAGLLDSFKNNNKLLEEIQKCLEEYLTSKRLVFPRWV